MDTSDYYDLKQKVADVRERVEDALDHDKSFIVRDYQRFPIAIYFGVVDLSSPKALLTYDQILENSEDWCVEFLLSQVV